MSMSMNKDLEDEFHRDMDTGDNGRNIPMNNNCTKEVHNNNMDDSNSNKQVKAVIHINYEEEKEEDMQTNEEGDIQINEEEAEVDINSKSSKKMTKSKKKEEKDNVKKDRDLFHIGQDFRGAGRRFTVFTEEEEKKDCCIYEASG